MMELRFLDYSFGPPKYSELECRDAGPDLLRAALRQRRLLVKETGEIKRQRVFMGDFPHDDGPGDVHHQRRRARRRLPARPLARACTSRELEDPTSGRDLFSAKVIPNRGAWLEFETTNKDQLWVKVDRKRKIPVTTLLRAVGYETNDEIVALFARRRHGPEHPYIANTLDKDLTNTQQEALIEVYGSCARATRRPVTTRASWSRACSSTSAATTSAGSAATRSTRSSTASPAGWGSSCRATQRTITREDVAAIVGQLIELQPRHRPEGRHRPPRQPPHARRRRADPERVPHRPAAHGARHPRAHDDPGDRQGDAERADQHPPGRGGDEGVLRRLPAVASSWTRRTRWPS